MKGSSWLAHSIDDTGTAASAALDPVFPRTGRATRYKWRASRWRWHFTTSLPVTAISSTLQARSSTSSTLLVPSISEAKTATMSTMSDKMTKMGNKVENA